jgi:hypothetical protein
LAKKPCGRGKAKSNTGPAEAKPDLGSQAPLAWIRIACGPGASPCARSSIRTPCGAARKWASPAARPAVSISCALAVAPAQAGAHNPAQKASNSNFIAAPSEVSLSPQGAAVQADTTSRTVRKPGLNRAVVMVHFTAKPVRHPSLRGGCDRQPR